MADLSTNLDTISSAQSQKEVTANAVDDAESPASFGGRHASQCSGLTWGYYGGKYRDGSNVTQMLSNGTLALANGATNYIEFDKTSGTVSSNTSAFTSGRTPFYTATTSGGVVTNYIDERVITFATTP